MIRLAIASLARGVLQAYRDILGGGVGVTRRLRLNFTGGGVSFYPRSDADPLASTDIAIPGISLTIVNHTAPVTLQPGEIGRFINTTNVPFVVTFADGTAAGQRIGAMLVTGSNAAVYADLTNVDLSFGESLSIRRSSIFVWNRIGTGPFKWWLESTDAYLPS